MSRLPGCRAWSPDVRCQIGSTLRSADLAPNFELPRTWALPEINLRGEKNTVHFYGEALPLRQWSAQIQIFSACSSCFTKDCRFEMTWAFPEIGGFSFQHWVSWKKTSGWLALNDLRLGIHQASTIGSNGGLTPQPGQFRGDIGLSSGNDKIGGAKSS